MYKRIRYPHIYVELTAQRSPSPQSPPSPSALLAAAEQLVIPFSRAFLERANAVLAKWLPSVIEAITLSTQLHL